MVLFHGDRSKLAGQDWNLIEIADDSINVIKRMAKRIPYIFKDQSVEIFVPVAERNNLSLMKDSILFVRTTSDTRNVCNVWGAGFLVQDSQRCIVHVDDDYVQGLITQSKAIWEGYSKGILQASFVRILDGIAKELCGHIISMNGSRAEVEVNLICGILRVETPVQSLQNLDSVPMDLRVYYYCSAVQELADELGSSLFAQDLIYVPQPVIEPDPEPIKLTKEERSAVMKASWAKRTPEERAIIQQKKRVTRQANKQRILSPIPVPVPVKETKVPISMASPDFYAFKCELQHKRWANTSPEERQSHAEATSLGRLKSRMTHVHQPMVVKSNPHYNRMGRNDTISDEKKRDIWEYYLAHPEKTQTQIGFTFGVSQGTVSIIKRAKEYELQLCKISEM